MTAIVSLVTKPTVEQKARESVLEILRNTLKEAEAGEIHSIAMVLGTGDSKWITRISAIATNKGAEFVGQLEIMKQHWISKYLKLEDE